MYFNYVFNIILWQKTMGGLNNHLRCRTQNSDSLSQWKALVCVCSLVKTNEKTGRRQFIFTPLNITSYVGHFNSRNQTRKIDAIWLLATRASCVTVPVAVHVYRSCKITPPWLVRSARRQSNVCWQRASQRRVKRERKSANGNKKRIKRESSLKRQRES